MLEALRLATGKIANSFPNQPEVEAGVRQTIGVTYLRLGAYAEAEPMFRSAIECLQGQPG